MKTKLIRFNFAFPEEIASLIQKISEKTDLSYTAIVKRALKLLAEKEGVARK